MDPKDNPPSPARASRPRAGRPLLWGAALLVALAGVLIVVLWPARVPVAPPRPARPTPPEAAALPMPTVARAPVAELRAPAPTPALPAAPGPAPVPLGTTDLFAGDVPEVLGMGRKVVIEGGRLRSSKLKEIYEYGKDNPTDARPQLIMAADSVNRGWVEFAINHYERAYKADPRARDDPRMLSDLVELSTSQHHGEKAAASLQSIYGASAAPAVLAAVDRMTAEGHPAKAERLARLASSLSEAPP